MNQPAKKNLNRLFTLLLCISLSTFATAQSTRTMGSLMPSNSVDAVVAELSAELSLSNQQIAKLTKICTNHQEKQGQKVEAARGDSATPAQNTAVAQNELDKEISNLLTQQQRSLFNALSKKYSPKLR